MGKWESPVIDYAKVSLTNEGERGTFSNTSCITTTETTEMDGL